MCLSVNQYGSYRFCKFDYYNSFLQIMLVITQAAFTFTEIIIPSIYFTRSPDFTRSLKKAIT